MGPQHTFNSPHLLPTLTFPCIFPYLLHTPSHFPTPPLIPLPTSPLPPPTPNTFSYYPYITLHFLKVWRSYRVTKFLWRSYCGEVTMWRSYWQPYINNLFNVNRKNACTTKPVTGKLIRIKQKKFGFFLN